MSEFISSKNLLPVVRILILEREHYKVLLHGITFQIPSVWTCFFGQFLSLKPFPELPAVMLALGGDPTSHPSVVFLVLLDLFWHEII